jgi:hypothetical protein
MNRVPGKHRMTAKPACAILWLAGLLLSTQALAQPPAHPSQVYYPGMMTNPWNPQPLMQPQVQPIQPAVQPTVQPVMQPGMPPQISATPVWNNAWQRPATQYYTTPYNRNWPTAPAAPTYRQTQPAQPQAMAPYLDTHIENNSAYVHQNLVLTVKVFSTFNLKTVDAEIQDSDDIILRQLGDITVDTRTRQGQKEIVNTIYYLLTPLRSGDIELEPLHIIGTMDSGKGYEISYDAVDSQHIHLTVSAPDPGVQPWLPLLELELSASLSNDELVGEGEPLTLTVVQRAVGMSGTQLPSLETQLQSPGHRLYREKTEYEGSITKEGKLVGIRMDRFTLVPQKGNEVKIPALRLDWWNVERQRKETAFMPGRVLNEGDRRPDEEENADDWLPGGTTASTLMWLTLLTIAFLLGLYWKRLEPGLRRSGRLLWQWLDIISKPVRQRLAALLVHLSPQRNLHIIRRWVADNLPRSARMWFCVRSADDEQDPDDWSQVLRFLVNRRLKLSANLPMSKLAELIIEIHPGADADKIRSLLGELEAFLFAGHVIPDFHTWKKEFKYQVRPRLFTGLRRRHRNFHATTLPGLNPSVS